METTAVSPESVLEAIRIASGILLRAGEWGQMVHEILPWFARAVQADGILIFDRDDTAPGENPFRFYLHLPENAIQPAQDELAQLANSLERWRHMSGSGVAVQGRSADLPPYERRMFAILNIASFVAVPIFSSSGRPAKVLVFTTEPRAWSNPDLHTIHIFSNLLSEGFEQQSALASKKFAIILAEARASELELLRFAAEQLNHSNDLEESIQTGLDTALLLSGAHSAWVVMLEEDGQRIAYAAYNPAPASPLLKLILDPGEQCKSLDRLARHELVDNSVCRSCSLLHRLVIGHPETHQHISFPLRAGKAEIGVLSLAFEPGQNLQDVDLQQILTLRDQMGSTVERARLFSQTNHNLEREQLLNRFSQVLSSSLDLRTIVQNAARLAAELLEAQDSELLLLNLEPGQPPVTAAVNYETSSVTEREITTEILSAALVNANSQRIAPQEIPAQLAPILQSGFRHCLSVPVEMSGFHIGLLNLYTQSLRRFSQRDLGLAETISRQAGTAVQNAILFDSVQRSLEERKRAEGILRRRDAILEAVSAAAEKLLETDVWESRIQDVLVRLGNATNAARVRLMQRRDSSEVAPSPYAQRYVWCDPDLIQSDQEGCPEIFPNGIFPRWEEQLSHAHTVSGPFASFPTNEQTFLGQQNIIDLVVAPIFTAGRWWGFLLFESPGLSIPWSPVEVDALKTACDILGAAIHRQLSFEALRESEWRNRALLDAIPDWILRVNLEGRLIDFKASSEFDLNLPPGTVGQDIMNLVPPKTASAFNEMIKKAFETGKPQLLEFELPSSQGGHNLEARLVVSGYNEIMAIIRDISERSRLEQMKSDFINRAAHDLRTPLATALLMIDLIQEGGEPDEIDECWKTLQAALDKQRLLVEDLLTVGRLEAGTFQINPQAVSLLPLLEDVKNELQPLAERKSIQMTIACPDILPAVLGDPSGLRQVFINLLDNALKYTPYRGKVDIRVELAENKVMVMVHDSGMGIPPEDIPNLFSRFFRASNAIHNEIPGSGIGLYIVKSILEKVSGQIHVQSKLGEGTSFEVSLALYQS